MRKWFHVLAFLVYAVGVAVDADFLGLAAAHMTFVFLVLEVWSHVCTPDNGLGVHCVPADACAAHVAFGQMAT